MSLLSRHDSQQSASDKPGAVHSKKRTTQCFQDDGGYSKKGPPGVHRHLSEFKDYSWQPVNSYVHGGIHAVNRSNAGYPVNIHYSAVRQSNNLLHMSAIALAQLINDGDLAMEVVNLYKKHADCLQLT